MSDKAFVELKFSKEIIELFDNFLKKIIPEDMLYSSPVVEHIRGNMSKTLHCTIFFGLSEHDKDNIDLQEILKENVINEIELGELSYIDGYENLYKVLVIEVLDKDGKLNKLYNSIEDFALKKDSDFKVKEFKPHLTLAYVQSIYEMPQELPNLPKQLEVSEIKISLLSEFNKKVNSIKYEKTNK